MNEILNPDGEAPKNAAAESLTATARSAEQTSGQAQGDPRPRTKPHIATEQECLAALTKLPGLVMLGVIDIQQANAFRGIHSTILQHLARRQASTELIGADRPRLAALLSKHPELASELEPLLSDEQIAKYMRQASEDDDGVR